MYKNKNNSGFAHHALLGGVLVIAITSFVGVKVLTASHAQNLQSANTRSIVLPSCGWLRTRGLGGIQASSADPDIEGYYDAAITLQPKIKIHEFVADFQIRNVEKYWSTSSYKKDVFPSYTRTDKMHHRFQIPIWVVTADPSFTWTYDFWGYKGPFRTCHSEIKGQATAVCDAKTGLWRLVWVANPKK